MKNKISHHWISSLKPKGRGLQMWFTLVEIMVAITIFMIVMISVMQIFGISMNLTNKVDINRQVQENVKNLTETIKEDIRKNWITWVWTQVDSYDLNSGNWLKLWDIKYYLSNDNENLVRLFDVEKCRELKNNCFLVKDDWITKSKLTNSWVAFENLDFQVMWDKIKKLAINFVMRPSTKKWINSSLIQNSKLIFQTTISQRFVKTN